MGYSVSFGSKKAGWLMTTSEVSGRKKRAKDSAVGRRKSVYGDEKIIAVMVAYLKGAGPTQLFEEFEVSKSSIHGWIYLGNRSDLMQKAEELVPISERAKVKRGTPSWRH